MDLRCAPPENRASLRVPADRAFGEIERSKIYDYPVAVTAAQAQVRDCSR